VTRPCVSIVIPCYNEERIIARTAERLLEALPRYTKSFEIVFANDGSTDRTDERLKALRKTHACIKVTGYPTNKGAGYAMRKALEITSGDLLLHMDADLAMDLDGVCRETLRRLQHCDIVIASRYLGTRAQYPLRRRVPSLVYRWVYGALFDLPIHDAMSGFFGLRRSVLATIAPLEQNGFEVYLELFTKAKRHGLSIEEFPEKFVHDTTSGEISVMATAPRQLANTFRLWWRLRASGRPDQSSS
jgi:glycosyltransferase involved in cell wall biosynthesis